MPKPLPWSYTALEDFVNCPKAYYEKRVARSVKEEPTEHTIWGTTVHLAFEERQRDKTPLPPDLEHHEPLMKRLDAIEGDLFCERKVALDVNAQPCKFLDDEKKVWWRGVIDWTKVNRPARKATVFDYKTGKPHTKFQQLKLFSLHTFADYPEIDEVSCKFYWTKTQEVTSQTYTREQIPELWKEFMPNLRQYVEAFKTDTWQPRQSGLCYGWCPVTTCEFWKPKKVRR